MKHIERAWLWFIAFMVISQTVEKPISFTDWVGALLSMILFVMGLVEFIRSFSED